MKPNKVVYRHRRNDTNEVFYVGIGNLSRSNIKYGTLKTWLSGYRKNKSNLRYV